jgi:hypothetical protein
MSDKTLTYHIMQSASPRELEDAVRYSGRIATLTPIHLSAAFSHCANGCYSRGAGAPAASAAAGEPRQGRLRGREAEEARALLWRLLDANRQAVTRCEARQVGGAATGVVARLHV